MKHFLPVVWAFWFLVCLGFFFYHFWMTEDTNSMLFWGFLGVFTKLDLIEHRVEK
jgi:hypothetical protein